MFMADKTFYLIVYDISNDKRRTKLHKVLLDYGTPVQYSVFECLLKEKEHELMLKAVERVIKPKVDHVRFYTLCERCLKKTKTTAGKEVLSDFPDALVVG